MSISKRYRKTAIVEAFQWNGEYPLPYPLEGNWDNNPMTPSKVSIRTLEGWLNIKEGDYVIKGIQGEYYPCDQAVFMQTYQEVST